ncbi:TPA: prepilin peptidase [Escherichia coli]|nr:prepilin peptidase [Escherichia coli]HEL8044413.1 prepilin peptidase [Escherichia coli]HEL8049225.1 prepilin peptidase [Escherichia coli]HEL8054017.1 prepilin peptidase [Escherichia coli]HEL8058875.1 prepilin peptidase [Escherichia coli]
MQNSILIYIAIYWFTSVISSFICLAVDRLPHQMRWRDDAVEGISVWFPPSRCDKCNIRLRWFYLIPVFGYFISRGRCRNCGVRIPYTYPLVEFIGGAGSSMLAVLYGYEIYGLTIISIYLVLIFLSFIDIRETWLPFIVTIPLFWAGLFLSPFESVDYARIAGAGVCFFMFWFSMTVSSLLSKDDTVAGGDIMFATAVGAWIGVNEAPLFIILSSAIFIIYAFPFRLRGIRCVPMGPAIAVGFLVCIL